LARWGHAGDVIRHASKRAALQAGRELARYDARGWVGTLTCPAVSVVTAGDTTVPPAAQRELADLAGARVVEVPNGHTFCLDGDFPGCLVAALVAA
jgi:pimeloyl-ACP methyl ester carboxylesterase